MKKLFLTSLSLLLPSLLFAYCSMPVFLENRSIPCASGFSSDPSQVHALLWLQGKADWTTNGTAQVSPGTCIAGTTYGGCDSDGVDVMDEGCEFVGSSIIGPWDLCVSGNPGEYYLLTDWSTMTYDGCPSTSSSERAILLIYDDTGKYVLQSRSQGKVWTDWDEIGTTEAQYPGVDETTGYWYWEEDISGPYARISFGSPSGYTGYGAYSAGDAPAAPLVTGYRLYYYNACEYPPTNFSTSAWVPGPTYPISTSNVNIRESDFPVSTSPAIIVSRAFIVDGKELPSVSSRYVTIYLVEAVIADYEECQCGAFYVPYEYYTPLGPGSEPRGTLETMRDGVPCAPCPWTYPCGEEHSFSYRTSWGNWTSCWQTYTFSEPSDTVITSIVDNDPNNMTGVTINYIPTVPATRHDLYVDGSLVRTNIFPGEIYNALDCNGSHSYQIAAQVDWGPPQIPENVWCTTYWSNTVSATDGCLGAPGELALGETSGDALIFSNDKTTASWPSYTGATGYRLYRGTLADLANLPGGTVDNSCLRYDGTVTSIDLSGDAPTSESFFWYLVTAYNGSGEGPAGTGRIINSSGGCP